MKDKEKWNPRKGLRRINRNESKTIVERCLCRRQCETEITKEQNQNFGIK